MNGVGITMAFVMGLTGSLHCAGMCGPIIWIMPFNGMKGFKKWLGISLYHFGRISIYALLGLVLHSFKSFFHPQWQQYISIILGAMLLVAGLLSFLPGSKIKMSFPWAGYVQRQLGKVIGRPGVGTLFVSGLLNGLLPCGLVYMALTVSITAVSAWQSMLLMYAFGTGTVPMLVALTVLKDKAKFVRSWNVRHLVPAVMFVFGALFIVRGMNLGIPYLSPKISIEHNQVKASCCHKQ